MEERKRYAQVTAVGGFVPEDVLTNDEIAKHLDTNDEWITTRVGIKERRVLKVKGAGSSYLGAKAIEDMIARHDINKDEIDFILCSTNTPDYHFPSTASVISDMCGIKGVPCIDFQGGCPGFIYGLQLARGFVESGIYKKVIVVATEKMSAATDPTDRSTFPLFGDGAGCVLVEPSSEAIGIMDGLFRNDNSGREHLIMPAGGSVLPPNEETVRERLHYVHQDGKQVFKQAVTQMGDISVELMERNNLTFEDIAWVVPHQANMRIIDATARRIGLGMDKVMVNIEKYGNTSTATIPLCLWEWEQRLHKGDNLILTAFGAGFTWGSIWLKWGYDYHK